MADVILVKGEFGFDVEITVYDGDTGAIKDLSGFDGTNVLDVKPTDYGASVLTNKTVTFTLKAAADALMGQYRGIYCRVSVTEHGQEVRQATGYGILRVDAPRGVKTSSR